VTLPGKRKKRALRSQKKSPLGKAGGGNISLVLKMIIGEKARCLTPWVGGGEFRGP